MFSKLNLSDIVEEIIAGIFVAILITSISYIASSKLRNFTRNQIAKVGSLFFKLIEKWRYIVIILMLFGFEALLFFIYADWQIICFSLIHFLIVFIVILILFRELRTKSKMNVFEDNFRLGLNNWVVPKHLELEITEKGLKLIPSESYTKRLSNVFHLRNITTLINGIIECDVYLEPESLINIIFRGKLQDEFFYMGRLDSRANYFDCILFNTKGLGWRECNFHKGTLKHRSSNKKWLNMKIVIKNKKISLFRNGTLVDKITDAKIISGTIGIFSEVSIAYIRKIKLIPTKL